MGLRVNTNTSALSALRALSVTDRAQQKSLTRLATGLRINSGGDDPGGLLISEQLHAQIISTQQALENVQIDTAMIATADGGLQNISDLLAQIKDGVLFTLNSAAASPEAIQAQQDTIDAAISSITRQAQTTQFNGRSLLDGSSQIVTDNTDSDLDNLVVRNVQVDTSATAPVQPRRTITLAAVANPTRANISVTGLALASATTFLVTGPRGSAEITLAAGATQANFASAVNSVLTQTGVHSNVAGSELNSEDFGTSQKISLKVLATGTGVNTITTTEFGTLSNGDSGQTSGVDGVITVDGVSVTGKGRSFDVNLPYISFSFEYAIPTSPTPLAADVAAETLTLAAATFDVYKAPIAFQVGGRTTPSDLMSLGIRSVTAASLGFEPTVDFFADNDGAGTAPPTRGGTLMSLMSGGFNSLALRPSGASAVVDKAITQVNGLRAQLGALQANVLDPQQRQLQVQIENLSAARGVIRDLDFAAETSNFTKQQILFQSGTAALASANLISQSVLTLLR
ncbi:MAG: hypothetical protein HYY93_08780 [Planctomycetes bacterium]|nr:hypothetical protein [Planctomycetota bacterium]